MTNLIFPVSFMSRWQSDALRYFNRASNRLSHRWAHASMRNESKKNKKHNDKIDIFFLSHRKFKLMCAVIIFYASDWLLVTHFIFLSVYCLISVSSQSWTMNQREKEYQSNLKQLRILIAEICSYYKRNLRNLFSLRKMRGIIIKIHCVIYFWRKANSKFKHRLHCVRLPSSKPISKCRSFNSIFSFWICVRLLFLFLFMRESNKHTFDDEPNNFMLSFEAKVSISFSLCFIFYFFVLT